MKAAFDKAAPDETGIGFYDKMEREYARAKQAGHRFVVGGVDPTDQQGEFSTALVSKKPGDLAIKDLDVFCYGFPNITVMAVLNTDEPFERQMRPPECSDEGYLKDPVINLPDRAKGYEDIAKVIYRGDVPWLKRRQAFGLIDGGTPEASAP